MGAILSACLAFAQDPSLGEIARKAKTDKQSQSKAAKHVYTSDDMNGTKPATGKNAEKKSEAASSDAKSKTSTEEANSEVPNKTLSPEEESTIKGEIRQLKDRIAE